MNYKLSSVKKNTVKEPTITIHGDPGVGKTTFAAQAPNPIFICTEDGLGKLEIDCFPLMKSFSDVLEAIGSLYMEKHDYKTLVLDSLDWLEPLIWNHVCETWIDAKGNSKRIASIEDAGYGKGYIEASNYWRQFFEGLRALRDEKQMKIVMIAHSAKVKVENPMLPAYDRWDLKLHKRAAAMAEEYSDIILFAQFHTAISAEGDRNRAVSNGQRIIHTVGHPSFNAKNRYGLESPLPLDYSNFNNAMKEAIR